MGYAVYEHRAYNDRFGGYGVPALCDLPGCDEKIDRGLSYSCGNGPDNTCGKYFCSKHLHYWDESPEVKRLIALMRATEDEDVLNTFVAEYAKLEDEELDPDSWPRCSRCTDEDWTSPGYPMKAELEEWIEHVLTNETWAEFRELHPGFEEDWRKSDG